MSTPTVEPSGWMPAGPARARRRAVGLLALALVAGCSAAPEALVESGATTATTATTGVPVPPGISVSLVQGRVDIARGLVSIEVHNDGDEPVEVVAATYLDPRFSTEAAWTGDARIPAGATRDLRVEVPGAACGSGDGSASGGVSASGEARVEFATAEGRAAAQFPVEDPFDFVARVSEAGCFAQRVDAAAAIELTGIGSRTGPDGEVAVLELTFTGRGSESVRVDSVAGTVLLRPASGEADWTVGTTVGPGAASGIGLEVVPTRCDAHAVAEDKVGTLFETTVTIAGSDPATGVVTLAATDEQRGDLYDFIARRCAQTP